MATERRFMSKITLELTDEILDKIIPALTANSPVVPQTKQDKISHVRFYLIRQLTKLIEKPKGVKS